MFKIPWTKFKIYPDIRYNQLYLSVMSYVSPLFKYRFCNFSKIRILPYLLFSKVKILAFDYLLVNKEYWPIFTSFE